jgi:hypothetical protein
MSSQQTSDQARPVERVGPPEAADERATLSGMLDFLRDTVVYKVAGLTDEQALPGRRLPGRVGPLTRDHRGSLLR